MSRSAFTNDLTSGLGNYREELMKSKEMMTHGATARGAAKVPDYKFGLKSTPRSARPFQFGGNAGNCSGGGGGVASGLNHTIGGDNVGGGGESGDFTKSESCNYEKSVKDIASNINLAYRERSNMHNHIERNCDLHKFSSSADKICTRRCGNSSRDCTFTRNVESKKVCLQTEPKTSDNEDFYVPASPRDRERTRGGGGVGVGIGGGLYNAAYDTLDDDWGENVKTTPPYLKENSQAKIENVTEAIEEALYGSPRSAANITAAAVPSFTASTPINTPSTPVAPVSSTGIEMNFVVFFGLLMGIAAAKFIHLIHHYFGWILEHVLQIRNLVLGPYSLADLLNFEDGSRFSLRQKLILLPVISVCCVVYSLVSIFNTLLRISLNKTPKRLVGLLQKWQTNQMGATH